MRLVLIAPVVLITVAAAHSDEAKPVAVPFEMLQSGNLISGHLAVQVKVNGKGPYRFVFDTGAPTILVSTRVGKEAGLTADKRPAKPGVMAFPGEVRIRKLEVGGVAAEKLTGIMLDHPTVKAIAEVFGPIDGIVGFPFFARFRTSIDYKAQELTFVPNGYKPGDVIQMVMATLLQPRGKDAKPQVLGAAGQWGIRVEKAEGDGESGVTVAEVFSGGAAAKAGIKAGDRLLTLNGRWTDSVADCYRAAADVKPDQPAELALSRDGREIKLTVRPAEGL